MNLLIERIILCFFLLISPKITAQKKEITDSPCTYEKSNKKMKTTYPFNETDKIVLYSYKASNQGHPRLTSGGWDTTYTFREPNYAQIVNGYFEIKSVFEQIILTKKQKKKLFSIFFDYVKKHESTDNKQMCMYEPRNCIVFFKKGKAIAFYEICFKCEIAKSTFEFDNYCDEKISMIKKFFQDVGITKGFDHRDDRIKMKTIYPE